MLFEFNPFILPVLSLSAYRTSSPGSDIVSPADTDPTDVSSPSPCMSSPRSPVLSNKTSPSRLRAQRKMRHRRNNSLGRSSFGKGAGSPSKEIPPPPPPLHSGTLPRTAKERLRHAGAVHLSPSDNDKSDSEKKKLKRAQSENFKYFGPHASIREPELIQNQQNENRNCHSMKSLNQPLGQKASKVRPGRPIPVSDRGVSTAKQFQPSDSSQLYLGSGACISTNPSYIPTIQSSSPPPHFLPASDSDDMNSNTPTDITPTSLNYNCSSSNGNDGGCTLTSSYIGERLAITHKSPMRRAGVPGGARRISHPRRSPSPTKRRTSQGRPLNEVVINITKVS